MRRAIRAAILLLSLTLLIHDAASGRFSVFRKEYTVNDLDSALTKAAKGSDWRQVYVLLGRGATGSYTDRNGRTLLHLAADRGEEALVRRLVESGMSVNIRDDGGCVPIHYASNRQVAAILIAAGSDLDAIGRVVPEGGGTPLHFAARQGRLALVEFLIDSGADVNARGRRRTTPLHWAANPEWVSSGLVDGDFYDVVQVLVSHGADLEAEDSGGCTPFEYALGRQNLWTLRVLIENGADVKSRLTPLHIAVIRDEPNVVEALLRDGMNPSVKGPNDSTPLHFAVTGSEQVAAILLKNGAEVNARNGYGFTPVDTALRWATRWKQEGRRAPGGNPTQIATLLRQHGGKTGKELDEEAREQRSEVRDQRSETKSKKEKAGTEDKQ